MAGNLVCEQIIVTTIVRNWFCAKLGCVLGNIECSLTAPFANGCSQFPNFGNVKKKKNRWRKKRIERIERACDMVKVQWRENCRLCRQ